MSEDIYPIPAGKVEGRTSRQKAKTGISKAGPVFSCQHNIELFLQLVQVKDIRGRIIDLGLA